MIVVYRPTGRGYKVVSTDPVIAENRLTVDLSGVVWVVRGEKKIGTRVELRWCGDCYTIEKIIENYGPYCETWYDVVDRRTVDSKNWYVWEGKEKHGKKLIDYRKVKITDRQMKYQNRILGTPKLGPIATMQHIDDIGG